MRTAIVEEVRRLVDRGMQHRLLSREVRQHVADRVRAQDFDGALAELRQVPDLCPAYDRLRPHTWPGHELDAWLAGKRWVRFSATRFAGRGIVLLLDHRALADARAAHPRTAVFTVDEATRMLDHAPSDEMLRAILELKAGTDGEFVFDPAPPEPMNVAVQTPGPGIDRLG